MRQERSCYDRDRIGERDQSAHLAIVASATRWGCLPSGREGIICRVVEKLASRSTRARPIAESLAGKNVLVTGVTGFLGQAVFERLLKDFAESRITLLVRPQLGSSGRQRVESMLGRPTFNALRDEVGGDGIKALLDQRVHVVDGDFSRELPSLPGDIDVVIHCAATVSFAPPIDEGFQTNLLGAVRLYEAALAANAAPHLVHVSTAYVAGVRKGVIPEATLDHRVDWRAEAELALRARDDVEAASRKPEILDSFLRKARAEHGRAGPQSVADDAEERRKSWVTKRLVQYGRARAQTLGWPDNYTFTKAMGERAVAARTGQACLLPRFLRRPEPAAVPRSVRGGEGVLRARPAAAVRSRRHQGSGVVVPRSPPRGAAPQDRRTRRRHRGQGRHAPAEVEEDARPRLARRSRQGARGVRPALLGPVRRLHRGRSHLHRRPNGRAVRVAHRDRPGEVPVRRRDGRLEVLPAGRALPRGDGGTEGALERAG